MGMHRLPTGGSESPGAGSATPASAQRILLVDDQPFFLTLGETILRMGDYAVQTAANGVEAMKLARATQPDAILLDVEMPAMDGFAVCRRLKEDPLTAAIPVLMLTATQNPQLNKKAFEAGAVAVILKSTDAGRLLNALHLALTTLREQRIAPRAAVALAVTYQHAAHMVTGETLNLSQDGMFIKTPSPAAMGAVLLLKFALPGARPWEGTCRVVWIRRPGEEHPYPPGMAVQFLEMPSEARPTIAAFVATVLATPAPARDA